MTFRWEQGDAYEVRVEDYHFTRDPSWLGPAIPPGEMLLEEFLKPRGLGQTEAARKLGISLNRLNEIVLGKRSMTADTSLRLARVFKTSPQRRRNSGCGSRRTGICTGPCGARQDGRPDAEIAPA